MRSLNILVSNKRILTLGRDDAVVSPLTFVVGFAIMDLVNQNGKEERLWIILMHISFRQIIKINY